MAPLAILPTTRAAPDDCSDSDSGIGVSTASHKPDKVTLQQPPGSSASDGGCEERTGLARSRLAITDYRDAGSSKSRRKSTGGLLTRISALQCLLPGSPDPNSGPPYIERFQPLNKLPDFQIQLKSKIEKKAPKLSTVSAALPAEAIPGEAFAAIDINGTNEARETSLELDGCPQSNLPTCPNEPDQIREASGTPSHYGNEFFEVRESGLSGLGAFALQDLKKGQRILTEPVLLKANPRSIYDEYDKLTPAKKQAYNSLFSQCPEHATGLERVRDIYDVNSFNVGGGLCGVYPVTARFNHACPPARNVTNSFKGARQDISLRMTKDVTAGTELTLTYATCQIMLYRNWGFVCSCGSCTPLSQEELDCINMPPTW